MVRRPEPWPLFVQKRWKGWLALWPCAAPSNRSLCPRHGDTVGPVTGICLQCHDELYEQAATEFRAR